MAQSNLFQCYVQDYTVMPSAAGTGLGCPILGAQFDKARLSFMAAKEPPADAPALFAVRIKGEFTEYPSPKNIGDITQEMRECFAKAGLERLGEPKICWRAKANDMWMEDEHIPLNEHDLYAEIIDQKSHQVVGGEALVAFEIPARDRDKLPAVKQAIDALIEQRAENRRAARG